MHEAINLLKRINEEDLQKPRDSLQRHEWALGFLPETIRQLKELEKRVEKRGDDEMLQKVRESIKNANDVKTNLLQGIIDKNNKS
ncbi:MAG: hypothetical protein MAG458_01499 [Nitrosopumilus sp.]|nr:hypothetical protein [Nitrosopumilus sp.]